MTNLIFELFAQASRYAYFHKKFHIFAGPSLIVAFKPEFFKKVLVLSKLLVVALLLMSLPQVVAQ